jgi:hypothetical protein
LKTQGIKAEASDGEGWVRLKQWAAYIKLAIGDGFNDKTPAHSYRFILDRQTYSRKQNKTEP